MGMLLLGLTLLAAQGSTNGVLPEETRAADARFAESVVEQGWTLIPAYSGEHRGSLDERGQARTAAAAHLFSAAAELQPGLVRALWSLGHAETLLAENARTRGLPTLREHVQRAEAALSRALEIDPADPWCNYARGALRTGFGAIDGALADLQRTDELTSARIPETGKDGNDAWLRFKAREWRPEALMQAGRFEEAREALRAFHTEFSDNAFPLHIALGECFLRERDLASADEQYRTIVELFPDDHQAYALRGYLAGLLNDRGTASAQLQEAIDREPMPGLYLRLWLWILATDEALPAADVDLREFLTNPPSSLSDWDRRLGEFCIGSDTTASFLDGARAEAARRMDASEALDELMCEAWFYVGLRLERDAAAAENEASTGKLLEEAMAAYGNALGARPVAWKWEWSFARLAYARLALATGKTQVEEMPTGSDGTGPGALTVGVHMPGERRARGLIDGRALPGQLWLGLREQQDGSRRFAYVPVLAR